MLSATSVLNNNQTVKYTISFFIDAQFVTKKFTNLYSKAAAQKANVLRGSSFYHQEHTIYEITKYYKIFQNDMRRLYSDPLFLNSTMLKE